MASHIGIHILCCKTGLLSLGLRITNSFAVGSNNLACKVSDITLIDDKLVLPGHLL